MSTFNLLNRGLGGRWRTSFSNLYRALPRSRQELLAAHQVKAQALKQAGVAGIGYDLLRSAVSLANIIRGDCPVLQQPFAPLQTTFVSAFPLVKYLPEVLTRELEQLIQIEDSPLILTDSKNGYCCQQLIVGPENRTEVEKIRVLVAEALYGRGYDGFSNEIDRSYDPNSCYLVVRDSRQEVVAVARMTFRTRELKLPTENGEKDSGIKYDFSGLTNQISEINSFFYRAGEKRAMLPILFAALGSLAWRMGVTKVICLVDSNNPKLQKLYQLAGFRFSEKLSEEVYFPTFGKTKEGAGIIPTRWKIMEMGPQLIFWHALQALKY